MFYSLKCFSAFLLITHSCCGEYDPPIVSEADVIIVGAGSSGIAAATKLDQHDINVKIFEAQERIGGRIHSLKFGDAYVDLGAEWCHGEKNNIVFNLMKGSDILKHPNYTIMLVDSNGNILDDELSEKLEEIFDELYDTDGTINATEEDTVGSYFTLAYLDAIKRTFSGNRKKYELAKLAYHTFNKAILSFEGCFSWFDPSALSDYQDCEGDRVLTWNGMGYKTILEKLMKNFDSEKKISLRSEVKQIQLDDRNNRVIVILANDEWHAAKYLIFTPSLGVLKHNHQTLFLQSLPREKVEAIEAIGIGAVMKVMIYFPERWWDQNASFSGYSFVWTQEDRDTLAVQFKKGPRKFGLSWLTDIMGVYRVEKNPNVLSCWFTGEFVPDIEQMDNHVLINGINFALNKFLGKAFYVQKFDAIVKSQWYSNRFTRGTYSYQTINSRKGKSSANIILSQPIMNKANTSGILFAGEATHPHYYSTVHGAIESGFREADRVIENIKKMQSNLN